ncbi:phage tail protein [Modicisalibacter coralii]|uniref:phage tail protein n=1 Tax=Modicisalibacter coralii TaxID=2304602 RepID=UPI00100B8613|nr:tail fiber protein [Halomonas coralii]
MDESYLGVIQALGFQFAPRNWGYCSGALISITQYQALFSLLGDTFGGDARTVFGLPDLRGRAPIGQFQGTGLTDWHMGQMPGQEYTTLTQLELPAHTHTHAYAGGGSNSVSVAVAKHPGTNQAPDDGDYIGMPANSLSAQGFLYVPSGDVTSTANIGGVSGGGGFDNNALTINDTGQGQPFPIVQPSLVVNYCICMQGLYPSRS